MAYEIAAPGPEARFSWQPSDGGAPLPVEYRLTIWLDSEGTPLSGSTEKFVRGERVSCLVSSYNEPYHVERVLLALLPEDLPAQQELPFS